APRGAVTEKHMLPTATPTDGPGHGVPPPLARTGGRAWIVVALSVLVLVALVLRLHTAWQRNHESPDGLRLVGDEANYEDLADALLQGVFFQRPVRVPVYPLFIAAVYWALSERSPANLLYAQAFVGVVVVPLTYLLARRLTGSLPALIVAGMVAPNDVLLDPGRQIYTQVLYTPLPPGAPVALIWAVAAPRARR